MRVQSIKMRKQTTASPEKRPIITARTRKRLPSRRAKRACKRFRNSRPRLDLATTLGAGDSTSEVGKDRAADGSTEEAGVAALPLLESSRGTASNGNCGVASLGFTGQHRNGFARAAPEPHSNPAEQHHIAGPRRLPFEIRGSSGP